VHNFELVKGKKAEEGESLRPNLPSPGRKAGWNPIVNE